MHSKQSLNIFMILKTSRPEAGYRQLGKGPPLDDFDAFCLKSNGFLNILMIWEASSPRAGNRQPGKGPPLLDFHAFG